LLWRLDCSCSRGRAEGTSQLQAFVLSSPPGFGEGVGAATRGNGGRYMLARACLFSTVELLDRQVARRYSSPSAPYQAAGGEDEMMTKQTRKVCAIFVMVCSSVVFGCHLDVDTVDLDDEQAQVTTRFACDTEAYWEGAEPTQGVERSGADAPGVPIECARELDAESDEVERRESQILGPCDHETWTERSVSSGGCGTCLRPDQTPGRIFSIGHRWCTRNILCDVSCTGWHWQSHCDICSWWP
jgi:hypothetical protein